MPPGGLIGPAEPAAPPPRVKSIRTPLVGEVPILFFAQSKAQKKLDLKIVPPKKGSPLLLIPVCFPAANNMSVEGAVSVFEVMKWNSVVEGVDLSGVGFFLAFNRLLLFYILTKAPMRLGVFFF